MDGVYVAFGLGFFGLMARERLGFVMPLLLGLVALPVVVWNTAAGGGNGLSLVWLVGAVTAYIWAGPWHLSPRKLQIGVVVGLAATACLIGRGLKTNWNFQDLSMVLCEAMIVVSGIAVLEAVAVLPRALRGACAFLASYS